MTREGKTIHSNLRWIGISHRRTWHEFCLMALGRTAYALSFDGIIINTVHNKADVSFQFLKSLAVMIGSSGNQENKQRDFLLPDSFRGMLICNMKGNYFTTWKHILTKIDLSLPWFLNFFAFVIFLYKFELCLPWRIWQCHGGERIILFTREEESKAQISLLAVFDNPFPQTVSE